MAESFTASLTVDKNIVEILSRSTYQRNFSYALREMVSNAYDADATKVSIDINRRNNSITIQDNGNGMTRDEFSYYLRIAGKKRGKLVTTRFRRKRIGQFGVGFLSVFPFCQTLKVTTSTENSNDILTATIPAAEFFAKPLDQVDVEELAVNGVIYSEPRRVREHFTTITLTGLTELAKASISTTRPTHPDQRRQRTASIWDASPLERLKWELSDELPIAFPKGSAYTDFFDYPESQLMEVDLNGERLYRNDVLGNFLDSGEFVASGVRCKYAICTAWKAIRPREMRYMKMRLNNVGVGARTDFDITRTRAYSRIAWLSGELHVLEGLEDLISVSRDGFVESAQYNAVREKMARILGKQALDIEAIEESSQAMAKQLGGGKQLSVAAKRDVVDKGIKKLAEKGFSVQRVRSRGHSGYDAISIDRQRKIVTLVEDHPSFTDEVTVHGKTYAIVFNSLSENEPPCKFQGPRTIIVNTDFPLFHSRRYGELFKRFCIILLVGSKTHNSSTSMLRFIFKELQTQFDSYK
jgi:hypothetical protein